MLTILRASFELHSDLEMMGAELSNPCSHTFLLVNLRLDGQSFV